jgi:hypothetical protein
MKYIVEMFAKLLKDGHCIEKKKNRTNLLPLSKIDRTNYLIFVAREPVFLNISANYMTEFSHEKG